MSFVKGFFFLMARKLVSKNELSNYSRTPYNVPECNGFSVPTFDSVDPVRRLMETVH